MPVTKDKKKTVLLNDILAAAKKLTTEEKHLLKIKLFGPDLLKQAIAFDTAMKKKRPVIKKTDEEIVKAIKKIRTKNAAQ